MSHPYADLPPERYWRRSVSAQAWANLDFKPSTRFRLQPQQRIATAGSCFAQHIARHLSGFGLTHWLAEPPPAFVSAERARALQYGLFSARYGNVYTVRQLRQLIEFAFGLREPTRSPVLRDEAGRCFDGLRPRVQPQGYGSEDELRADRAHHLGCVRRLFEQAQVFVFTLGLTEAWFERDSGIVFPVCPGTAAGQFDAQAHAFVNFDYPAVLDDLAWVHAFVREVNPALRWILTVSPVPLVATATAQPVLLASSHAKAVLRAAAGAFVAERENTEYFPSYEIIASAQSFGQYLEGDLREVSPRGVAHVMREFARTLVAGAAAAAAPAPAPDLAAQVAAAAQLECEELFYEART